MLDLMAWPRCITHNLGWKTVSVLLATLLWALIHFSRSDTLRFGPRKTFDAVPIYVLTPAADASTFQVDPPGVRLTVLGGAEALRRLRLSDVLVFVNLENIPEVEAYREVEVHLPVGVSLAALVPNQVRVIRLTTKPPSPSLSDP